MGFEDQRVFAPFHFPLIAVSGWMNQRQRQVSDYFARRTAFFESSSAAGGCGALQ
jgi:hypothetical protein